MAAYAFYGSLFLLAYTFVGYAAVVFIINKIKKTRKTPAEMLDVPAVTLIIPAYNEAECLALKLRNCLQLDYSADKLHIIVVTDGSTDKSNELVADFPTVQLLHQPARTGKMAAINHSMKYVNTPLVIFSDANTFLNKESVRRIVAHYNDEKVGGVAGEKKVVSGHGRSVIGLGEGLYWKYESMLKQLDSQLNTVVGAAGELFSMRTSLFTPQDEHLILDDFILSMKLCIDGYKVVYEPGAYAQEMPSTNITEERKRRVRIAAGAFQSIPVLWPHLRFFRMPVLYFQYVSRRIMRWIVSPVCLLVCFIANVYVASLPGASYFEQATCLFQLLFYATAAWGAINIKNGSASVLYIPFYFTFMHISLVQGFVNCITRKQTVMWEKSKRSVAMEPVN